jgi:proline iminopeptidase
MPSNRALPFLLLAAACTSRPITAPTPPAASRAPSSDLVALSSGVRIQLYALAGERSAPPVVVVNGGPGASHESVARLARLASAGTRIVAYDQRGLGKSSAPGDDARYSLDDQVADLDAVRTALGVKTIALVGHSFGALVAMAYVAAHPDRVAALVLVSPMAPDWDDLQASTAVFDARAKVLGAAGKLSEPPPPSGDDCRATSGAVLPVLFADPDFPRTHDGPESRDTQCSIHVQAATFATLPGFDVRRGLGAFHGPALVVVGEADPFGDGPSRAAAGALGSKPEMVQIPKCGHFPWIEGASAFDAALLPFLRAHQSTPAA